MIEKLRQSWFTPAFLRRRTLSIAILASVLAAVYWGFIASDRYVSEAHVVVQKTDLAVAPSLEVSSLLSNISGGSNTDQLLLRDHLLSVDMLQKLEARLKLRAHFSDRQHDVLSRMWSEDEPLEWFHRYYLSRVSVDFDEHAGVLIIKSQAYDAKTAHAISAMLVEEGERFMNGMAHRLAQAQVDFLDTQVQAMNQRSLQARQAVLAFQDKHGILSPQGSAENLVGIINDLETQLVSLQARRSAMLGYLMEDSPDIVELDQQIAAIEKQIAREQRRLTSPTGQPLNAVVEEFQRLQLKAEFAQEVYKMALGALEQGRVEATRTLKKVSVLQSPTRPQYPLEPRRFYNTVVFVLVALLLAGIVHLVAAIIRDHKD